MLISEITEVTQEDTAAFTDMIAQLQHDNYASYPWSELWCAMHFRRFIESSACDVLVAKDELGKYLGFAIATHGNLWFSPLRQYEEVVVITAEALPPMQSARALRGLLARMESRAEELKCNVMCVGTSTGVKSEAYIRVLENRGFRHFGSSLRKLL